MTKEKLAKMAEVVLLSLFCLAAVYITLASTVFMGTPPVITHSMNVVANRFMDLRTYVKKNAGVDRKLVGIVPQAAVACASDRSRTDPKDATTE
jgi:hypothetical protein